MRGRKSSCTAWRVIENALVITACEAITVAKVASSTRPGRICGGAIAYSG